MTAVAAVIDAGERRVRVKRGIAYFTGWCDD
jgi:ferric-dicitrate binding protein FerR (iron transport regulator)